MERREGKREREREVHTAEFSSSSGGGGGGKMLLFVVCK